MKIAPKIAFGLGSNVGNRQQFLRQAVQNLCGLQGLDASSIIKSEVMEVQALLPEGAPPEWDINYLNQVVVMWVHEPFISNPELLLRAVKIIEADMGRVERGWWSPREIDIDIIAIEGVQWHSETLQIPHAQAHLRNFVLQPLASIWAEAVLANGLNAHENMVMLAQAAQTSWSAQV